jgi:(R,R)-butanediol dehydrogenase / meso-butanediol dehydrogenase / diacetyl reductase
MRAARWYGRRDIRLEDVAPRSPSSGEVRIRVDCAGICATDLHEYTHGPQFIPTTPHPRTGRSAPVTMGHEFTGVIEAVGADVAGFKEGDRIVSEASLPCGRCAHCAKGEYILCREPAYLGFAWDGAFADSCTVPAAICHQVPANLKSQDAVLIEPLASAMHAVRRGRVIVGDTVAIVGTGTIGLSTLLCARAAGATHIYTFDKVASKRAKALEMGATQAWDPSDGDPVERIREATGGKCVDVAFECVGSTTTVALATRCTRVQGRTVVVGVTIEAQPFSFLDILLNEREVVGTAGYFGEFEICMDLVAGGRINPQPLITSRIELEDIVPRGFEPFSSPTNENIKIVVNLQA